jgi:hypothetical protein
VGRYTARRRLIKYEERYYIFGAGQFLQVGTYLDVQPPSSPKLIVSMQKVILVSRQIAASQEGLSSVHK